MVFPPHICAMYIDINFGSTIFCVLRMRKIICEVKWRILENEKTFVYSCHIVWTLNYCKTILTFISPWGCPKRPLLYVIRTRWQSRCVIDCAHRTDPRNDYDDTFILRDKNEKGRVEGLKNWRLYYMMMIIIILLVVVSVAVRLEETVILYIITTRH